MNAYTAQTATVADDTIAFIEAEVMINGADKVTFGTREQYTHRPLTYTADRMIAAIRRSAALGVLVFERQATDGRFMIQLGAIGGSIYGTYIMN